MKPDWDGKEIFGVIFCCSFMTSQGLWTKTTWLFFRTLPGLWNDHIVIFPPNRKHIIVGGNGISTSDRHAYECLFQIPVGPVHTNHYLSICSRTITGPLGWYCLILLFNFFIWCMVRYTIRYISVLYNSDCSVK